MKKITFITDTHTKHKQLGGFLPGGDMLICAGDITSVGSLVEIENFCTWFDGINNYDHKIFIAGNHDWEFQDNPKNVLTILKDYQNGMNYHILPIIKTKLKWETCFIPIKNII